MCGIVGIFSSGEQHVSSENLHAATQALRHRGPDEQHIWLAKNGRIGLGHALLNIVSPHGAQPIENEAGHCWIAANGEFYGHVPIRQQLEAAGHRFRTDTDSEIALHLYEDSGMQSIERLRGEFAYILWDETQQTFYAVRDRFGIRSLFYAQVNGILYVASEAKALFAAGVPAQWDEDGVVAHMFGCLYPDHSLFKFVRQVPPGHYLKATRDHISLVRYWDLDYPRSPVLQPSRTPDPLNYVPQVRQLLEDSVRLRTEAYVPVGCLLSGGIDSSAVLALAAAQSAHPVVAFTIAFTTSGYNEIEKARTAAAHIGTDLVEIPVSDVELADSFAEAAFHAEMFQYNAHGTARFILTREIQKAGFRAVMAGEGADELFLGYGFLRNAVQSEGQGISLPAAIHRALHLFDPLTAAERQIATISPWLARAQRLLNPPSQLIDTFSRAISLLGGLLAEDIVAGFQHSDPYKSFFTAFPWRSQLWGRKAAHQLLYLWLRSIFITYHLAADRLDMGHAVEVRYPFLDHVLFEAMRNIPVKAMGHEHTPKYLLRQAARIWLPEDTWKAVKQPFYAPPMTQMPGSALLMLVQDTLRGQIARANPFFNRQAVVAMLDKMKDLPSQEQRMLDPLLLMMTSLCHIQDAFRL